MVRVISFFKCSWSLFSSPYDNFLRSSRMFWNEFAHIIDVFVDNYPSIFLVVVLANFLPRKVRILLKLLKTHLWARIILFVWLFWFSILFLWDGLFDTFFWGIFRLAIVTFIFFSSMRFTLFLQFFQVCWFLLWRLGKFTLSFLFSHDLYIYYESNFIISYPSIKITKKIFLNRFDWKNLKFPHDF